METKSVRVSGIQTPAYLNGRSREMLTTTFRTTAKPNVHTSLGFAKAMRDSGIQLGEGVPFAALYMMRAKKKTLMIPTAA